MTINENLQVVNVFVDQLYKLGVKNVVLSPGSRSTPLTMAFTRDERFSTWTILDERSAGFFSLGLAKQSGTPSVLVCTSGTAVGNYLPAIMEAKQSCVPLLVVTADRPPELYSVGSNQTIDQIKVFGTHVREFFQMPVPGEGQMLLKQARSIAVRAYIKSQFSPRGPVHINWPFREPLVPPYAERADELHSEDVTIFPPEPRVGADAISMIHRVLEAGDSMIVCGPQDDSDARSIIQLAEKYSVPVCTDVLSQLRGSGTGSVVIDTYDVFMRSEALRRSLRPKSILRFGRTPTSKVLGQYLTQHADAMQIVISEHADYHDPFFSASNVVVGNVGDLCRQVLDVAPEYTSQPTPWLGRWVELNQDVRSLVKDSMERFARVGMQFEGNVVSSLERTLPPQASLFIGNSMPIRDFDSFYHSSKSFQFLANRGVSGIDGIVSTALGVSAASTSPVVLVLGDVSFYHDLGALYVALKHQIDLLVILVNNNGGGIFSFLPQVSYKDTFHQFQTAHDIGFEPVANMFHARYHRALDWGDMESKVEQWLSTRGVQIIEVVTDVNTNVALHRQLFENVLTLLEGRL